MNFNIQPMFCDAERRKMRTCFFYFEDYEHSTETETRFNIIGQTAYYGLIFAVFIYVDEHGIHFITARRTENWMVKEYEENRKRL